MSGEKSPFLVNIVAYFLGALGLIGLVGGFVAIVQGLVYGGMDVYINNVSFILFQMFASAMDQPLLLLFWANPSVTPFIATSVSMVVPGVALLVVGLLAFVVGRGLYYLHRWAFWLTIIGSVLGMIIFLAAGAILFSGMSQMVQQSFYTNYFTIYFLEKLGFPFNDFLYVLLYSTTISGLTTLALELTSYAGACIALCALSLVILIYMISCREWFE
nr:hypothetical protein [Candidatus Freyarchaeota archaeon]